MITTSQLPIHKAKIEVSITNNKLNLYFCAISQVVQNQITNRYLTVDVNVWCIVSVIAVLQFGVVHRLQQLAEKEENEQLNCDLIASAISQ